MARKQGIKVQRFEALIVGKSREAMFIPSSDATLGHGYRNQLTHRHLLTNRQRRNTRYVFTARGAILGEWSMHRLNTQPISLAWARTNDCWTLPAATTLHPVLRFGM